MLVLAFSSLSLITRAKKPPLLTKAVELVKVEEKKPKLPDRVGEKIIYDVMLGNLKLGRAVFHYQSKSQIDRIPVNFITFETRLLRFKDNEKIYCHPGTFLPLRVEREISSWPKYEKITEVYDQEKFSLDIVKTENGRDQKINFQKDSVIHNAILLPYSVRQVADPAVGWNFQANLPTQRFLIRLAAIEELKVAAGVFKAYRFKSTPERFEIWISADERKIPLKIKGMAGIGYTLVMREYIPGTES